MKDLEEFNQRCQEDPINIIGKKFVLIENVWTAKSFLPGAEKKGDIPKLEDEYNCVNQHGRHDWFCVSQLKEWHKAGYIYFEEIE